MAKNSPQSYWLASTHATDYPELSEDIRVDVAIVGGGMAGILCAYLLGRIILILVIDAGKIKMEQQAILQQNNSSHIPYIR